MTTMTHKLRVELTLRKIERRSIQEGECKIWTGARNDKGYGQFGYNGYTEYVHVFVYRNVKGKIPKGLSVCHTCDRPLCWEPKHLFLGTQKDNAADAVAKGRIRHGEDHAFAVLTESDVRAIRASPLSVRELSYRYRCSRTNIYHVKARRTWGHI